MSKKTKLYIPLVQSLGYKGKNANRNYQAITLINANNIKSLEGLIPTKEQIQENILANQYQMSKFDIEYQPLLVKVSEEKFNELENEIKQKKPKHVFVKKGFDLISDSQSYIPLVQIIQI